MPSDAERQRLARKLYGKIKFVNSFEDYKAGLYWLHYDLFCEGWQRQLTLQHKALSVNNRDPTLFAVLGEDRHLIRGSQGQKMQQVKNIGGNIDLFPR